MAETFYPFVEGAGDTDAPELPGPTTSARIAVYDDMAMVPRVVVIEPTDIRTFLEQITQNVFELATQQGGDWSFMLIRELVENFIHASFSELSISILDKGKTLVFSDQGPGIPNKQAALKPSYSSATKAMKRYIRGVGSGLPIVEEQLRLKNGTITIEDNLGHGTIVTVSLVAPEASAPEVAPAPAPMPQTAPTSMPASYPYGMPGQPQAGYGAYGAPAQPQPGMGAQYNPYGAGATPYPYGTSQPPQPVYGQPAAQQVPYPGMAAPQPYGQPVPSQSYGYSTGYAPAPGYPAHSASPWPTAANGASQPVLQGASPIPGSYAPSQPMAAQQPVAPTWGGAPIEAHAALTEQQQAILRLFARTPKLGPTELHDQLGIAQATGSRRLGEMTAAGYIMKNGQKYILTSEGELMLSYLMNSEV